jgi:hypothetical protein
MDGLPIVVAGVGFDLKLRLRPGASSTDEDLDKRREFYLLLWSIASSGGSATRQPRRQEIP